MDKIAGPRQNMNGAGAGGRLVAKRVKGTKNTVLAKDYGRSQLGNREQRRADLRTAFAAEIRAAGGTTG